MNKIISSTEFTYSSYRSWVELHRLEVTSQTRGISQMWCCSNCAAWSGVTKTDFTYYRTTLTNFIRRQRRRIESTDSRRLIRYSYPFRLICRRLRSIVSKNVAVALPVFHITGSGLVKPRYCEFRTKIILQNIERWLEKFLEKRKRPVIRDNPFQPRLQPLK